jgi:ABC-type antimicrobial peptide transport system permease subunit
MDDLVDAGVGQRRLVVILLAAFAAAAVVLALIGIFGVISYSVTQRQQELGIRSALGAQRKDLLFLVMNQGAVLTLSGIGIGVAGALVLTRFLSGMLFEVRPNDPAIYIFIGLMVALVGLVASYLPAQRAMRTDPIAALRV